MSHMYLGSPSYNKIRCENGVRDHLAPSWAVLLRFIVSDIYWAKTERSHTLYLKLQLQNDILEQ